MSPSRELDGVDFRPFFDMVVGILFVLLILIGALIFFQQTQDGVEGAAAHSQQRRWRQQRDFFLQRLVANLQTKGLPASADTAAGAVLMPLDGLSEARMSGGLPELKATVVAGLAGALAPAIGCVSVPRASVSSCPDSDLLSLDGLTMQVRVGAVLPDAALPRDRAARFLAASLAEALYSSAPDLLRASDRRGAAVIGFDSGTLGNGQTGGSGDLELVFGFAPPAQ